jgi:Cu(I)/Ag(I) efflux system membrane fusion protein
MGLPDTSPVPKKDAMGMDYIAVYAGEEPAAEPGTVVLPPEKVQKLGVRTEVAVRAALAGAVRASATVQVDETRQFVVAPKFEGWIETLYANQTGMEVRKGQPLVALYSPELVAAQSEYQIADAAAQRLGAADPASAATMRQLRDAARTRLRNWDVGGAQVSRQGSESRLMLTAPADAVVVEKLVVQGDRFEPGQTILRLADLSTVWVVADVPTSAAADLTVGGAATFQTPSLPGQRFEGRVSFIQPLVNAGTRTIGVRIELPNPQGELRPGLFGDVDLTGSATDAAVVIPRSAVIDSGARQLVLVQTAPGRFAPRTVRLGVRSGDRIEVLSGVQVGEAVVVSANFLIDAESNLRSAMQGMDHGTAPPPSGEGAAAPADTEEAPTEPDPHASHSGGQ